MSTMVALVGGQTLPNILPILHYKPLYTLFVYTSTTSKQYKNLKTVLEKKKFNVYGIETDPYDISAIVKKLSDSLTDMATQLSQPLVFNLTGGTKSMSLAAYQVALERSAPVIYLQSEKGQSSIDHYVWRNHQLSRQQQENLPEYLDLHDVLELHLGPQKDEAGKDVWKVDKSIDPTNQGLLLELAIEKTLRGHGYEVLRAVKGKNNNLDVDVMIRYQNHIGIVEAKAGENGAPQTLDGIKQLSLAMRYLGSIYTKQFFVINGKPSDAQRAMCDILRIHIVSLPHYKRGAADLLQEDIDTLLAEVDKVMTVK
jgi:hypothetical protein